MDAEDKTRHGNRYDTGPTVAAGVGGLRGAWNGGVFAGDPELVTWAQAMSKARVKVSAFGDTFTCDDVTPMGALASLASYRPGRVIVSTAPEDVLAAIQREPEMIPEPVQPLPEWVVR